MTSNSLPGGLSARTSPDAHAPVHSAEERVFKQAGKPARRSRFDRAVALLAVGVCLAYKNDIIMSLLWQDEKAMPLKESL